MVNTRKKGNQKLLKEKVIFTAGNFSSPTDTHEDTHEHLTEGNKAVKRKVEIFQNKDCDLVMSHSEFKDKILQHWRVENLKDILLVFSFVGFTYIQKHK